MTDLRRASFLIDLTEARFKIPSNADVLGFVRRTNPSAHSDVGTLLFKLGEELRGAGAYCPSVSSCAYVVLHTATDRIFAIVFGQRGLAFRLGARSRREALGDGGVPAPKIGPDWMHFEPWSAKPDAATARTRLSKWCERAFVDTTHGAP